MWVGNVPPLGPVMLEALMFYLVVFVRAYYCKDVDMGLLTRLKKSQWGESNFMGDCAVSG